MQLTRVRYTLHYFPVIRGQAAAFLKEVEDMLGNRGIQFNEIVLAAFRNGKLRHAGTAALARSRALTPETMVVASVAPGASFRSVAIAATTSSGLGW